jgi:hypothetical protein
MKKNNKTDLQLKYKLFDKIECDGVYPRSKLFFRCHECIVWSLWLLSIAVGAVAVSVSLFVMSHHQYALYEATHDNLFTFLVEALPYIWIVVFGLMVWVAIYNLRHTSKGYRYPLWIILMSSIILSFAGGSALQFFGIGYTVDDILGSKMTVYLSQEKLEARMWQDPEAGRLLGKQIYTTLAPTTTIIFKDTNGNNWQINVSELKERDVNLLSSGEKVRVLGKYMNGDMRTFHACGAFTWMMDKNTSVKDMTEERNIFIENVSNYAKKRTDMTKSERGGRLSVASSSEKYSVCATIASVKRMPYKPQECGEACQN